MVVVVSVSVNSTAQIRVMSANWKAYNSVSSTYDTDWTKIVCGAQYEYFEIFSDSNVVFFVSFASGQADSLVGVAGEGIKRYFIADSLWVRTKSSDHVIHTNMFKRVAD